MRNDTERQRRKRRSAWRSVLFSSVTRTLTAALLVWVWLHFSLSGLKSMLVAGFILLDLGMLIPVWIIFKKRLKEIEGGEEDAAAQY